MDLSGNTLSISFKRLIHLKITNQGLEWTFSSLASRYPFLIALISLQLLFSYPSFPSDLNLFDFILTILHPQPFNFHFLLLFIYLFWFFYKISLYTICSQLYPFNIPWRVTIYSVYNFVCLSQLTNLAEILKMALFFVSGRYKWLDLLLTHSFVERV